LSPKILRWHSRQQQHWRQCDGRQLQEQREWCLCKCAAAAGLGWAQWRVPLFQSDAVLAVPGEFCWWCRRNKCCKRFVCFAWPPACRQPGLSPCSLLTAWNKVSTTFGTDKQCVSHQPEHPQWQSVRPHSHNPDNSASAHTRPDAHSTSLSTNNQNFWRLSDAKTPSLPPGQNARPPATSQTYALNRKHKPSFLNFRQRTSRPPAR
jgi:hypothetical protein